MKQLKSVFFAVLTALTMNAFADTAIVTGAEVSAAKDAAGNVTVSWTDPLKVSKVERYVGNGQPTGNVANIKVGEKKSAILADVAKNGGRFNLVTVDGKYLHLGCGDNAAEVTPRLTGLKVDCSFLDKDGIARGALVVLVE